MVMAAIFVAFFVPIWAVTAWYLFRNSSLSGPIRWVDAVAAFPLLIVLLTVNLLATAYILPGLISLLESLFRGSVPNLIIAPFALAATAPLPLFGFWAWRQIARRWSRPRAAA